MHLQWWNEAQPFFGETKVLIVKWRPAVVDNGERVRSKETEASGANKRNTRRQADRADNEFENEKWKRIRGQVSNRVSEGAQDEEEEEEGVGQTTDGDERTEDFGRFCRKGENESKAEKRRQENRVLDKVKQNKRPRRSERNKKTFWEIRIEIKVQIELSWVVSTVRFCSIYRSSWSASSSFFRSVAVEEEEEEEDGDEDGE